MGDISYVEALGYLTAAVGTVLVLSVIWIAMRDAALAVLLLLSVVFAAALFLTPFDFLQGYGAVLLIAGILISVALIAAIMARQDNE